MERVQDLVSKTRRALYYLCKIANSLKKFIGQKNLIKFTSYFGNGFPQKLGYWSLKE